MTENTAMNDVPNSNSAYIALHVGAMGNFDSLLNSLSDCFDRGRTLEEVKEAFQSEYPEITYQKVLAPLIDFAHVDYVAQLPKRLKQSFDNSIKEKPPVTPQPSDHHKVERKPTGLAGLMLAWKQEDEDRKREEALDFKAMRTLALSLR